MKHKCLASFLVLLLFFSISGIIVFYQVQKLTSANFLIKILNESRIYNNIDSFGKIIEQGNQDQSPQSKIYFQALAKNIDPNWVKSQIEVNLPKFMDYLNSSNPNLDITFDLRKYKENLPQNFREAIAETASDLPPCQEGQAQIEDNFPTCLPTGVSAEQISTQISAADIQSLVNEVHDTYNLSEVVKNPDKTFSQVRLILKILNIGLIVSVILTIILLGLLVILGLSYRPAILRWTGVALVLPSGLNLLLDGVYQLVQPNIQGAVLKGLNPQVLPIISPIIGTLSQNLMKPGFLISAIIFSVGFILIILSYALPHPPSPPSQGSGVAGGPEPKPPAQNKPVAPAPSTGLAEAK